MSRHRYSSYYSSPNSSEKHIKIAYLELPDEIMPPPVIQGADMGYSPVLSVDFAYTPTQNDIAKAFGLK